MFCEGYYLHRLISYAFEAPSSLGALYLIGWGKLSTTACRLDNVEYFRDLLGAKMLQYLHKADVELLTKKSKL